MHRSHLTFWAQTQFLNDTLNQAIVHRCFTHRKNELVLEIESDQHYFLRIGIDPQLPYILLYNVQNIKNPRTTFFDVWQGQKIQQISLNTTDKLNIIATESYYLEIQYFGKSANIILYDNNKNILDTFKNRSVATEVAQPADKLHFQMDFEPQVKILFNQHDQMKLSDFLITYFTGFTRILAAELLHRSQIETSIKINQLQKKDIENLLVHMREIHSEIQLLKAYLYHIKNESVLFTPLQLHHLTEVERREDYETINQAWLKFISTHGQKKEIDKQWHEIRNVLKRRVSYIERTLQKISDAELLDQRKKESELKGHLLQTFAHEIPKGKNKISLPNIFSEAQEQIEIKLNPAKSIHENAQKYYSKFKNIEEQKENLTVKKDTFQHELDECHKLLSRVQEKPSPKEIRSLHDKLIDMNLIQAQGLKQADRDNLAYSFNRLVLGKKWEIYIGKNAANNDLLTFKFARKFDLWLHAQGVPGSHVVIRKADRTQNPPQKIIEQAASIAAFNSDAKHATTVPVNVTEVRYVRKPRKSAPGTVTISNAKTLFVKPVQVG